MARTNVSEQRVKPQRRRREVQHASGTDWNNNLREIASLLPISDTMHGRGLTKKETLVHMLWYFEFLDTHIQNLKGRLPPNCLPVNETESESESEESIVSELEAPQPKCKHTCAHSQLSGQLPAGPLLSLRNGLDYDDIKMEVLPEEEDGLTLGLGQRPPMWQSAYSWTEPISDSDSMSTCSPNSLSSSMGLLQHDRAASGGHCSACDGRTSSEDGSPGQSQLTPSSGSLQVFVSENMCGGATRASEESQSLCSSFSTPLMPRMSSLMSDFTLNLSPSLLTSPTRGVNHDLLPQGQEDLHTLFEDVWVSSDGNASKIASLPSSQSDDSVPDWSSQSQTRKRAVAVVPSHSQSDEEEAGCDDVTWTPKLMQGRRRRKPRAKVQAKPAPDTKKKCVNGFIMFCRINRKLYLESRPGTPSTVVTKALANIWHHLPKPERRIYCLKARRYSCQENRNVRMQEEEEEEDAQGEECKPSPLHLLLADRRLCATARGKP
ncbi:meiosis initiator protein-like [Engraulis encrasicolus]|uniref:meiosis initiator protein-like n=1 Tax=Engraulis encrasicolus TaxID=184585 RepID=UPI002FD75EA8